MVGTRYLLSILKTANRRSFIANYGISLTEQTDMIPNPPLLSKQQRVCLLSETGFTRQIASLPDLYSAVLDFSQFLYKYCNEIALF